LAIPLPEVTVRRLVIVLIVVAVLLVFLDIGSRLAAQYAVSRNVAAALDLPERPKVSLGGFPFLPSFFAGSVPTVTVIAGTTTMGGVSIRDVHLTLRDVTFSAGALLTGGDGTIEAKRGEGEAVIDGATVPATVLGQTVTLQVRFEGDRTLVTAEGLPGSIDVDPALDDRGDLVLRPASSLLPVSVTVPLPKLVDGGIYTSLHVRNGVAALGVEVRDAVVPCCG
jgi:LmeA-like phospholipid-binding